MKLRMFSLFASLLAATDSGAQNATPADAINALGMDLYGHESAKEKRNVLLSPYSIHTALTMTLGGAGGKTLEEMARVLHLTGGANESAEQIAALRQELEKAAADSQKRLEQEKKYGGSFEPLQLRVANRLFGREGYPFHAEFLKRTEDQWKAPLETAPFSKDPEGARKRINTWVEEQTAKRIVDLIPQGGVTAGTRLVLVNALYFKASWAEEFQARATKPTPFFVDGKTSADVPTMSRKDNYGYSKGDGYAAVTIPYTGHALQFLVILPDAKDGLKAVASQLTGQQLTKLSKIPADREVMLYLPKFKIEPPTMELAKHLKALGMKTAFDDPAGSADFSRMAPRSPEEYLLISEVFHKTFLALDEKGTEAAAATAVAMRAGSAAPREKPKPIEFRVDHPFLFAIQHRETGACLFLGRVNDPR